MMERPVTLEAAYFSTGRFMLEPAAPTISLPQQRLTTLPPSSATGMPSAYYDMFPTLTRTTAARPMSDPVTQAPGPRKRRSCAMVVGVGLLVLAVVMVVVLVAVLVGKQAGGGEGAVFLGRNGGVRNDNGGLKGMWER